MQQMRQSQTLLDMGPAGLIWRRPEMGGESEIRCRLWTDEHFVSELVQLTINSGKGEDQFNGPAHHDIRT